jgi:adenine deaminase
MSRKIITDGQLVNAATREILPRQVVIDGPIITFIGPDASSFITSTTEVIDARGRFLVPGLISAHDHTEMGLMSVVPFAEAVLPFGTTAVLLDPHDTVNVLGMQGLQLAVEESKLTNLKCFFTVPPCVPPAPRLETAGCRITLKDVQKGMGYDRVIGLAEAMDFNGILREDPVLMEIFGWAKRQKFMVDGHCPELRGADLARYIAAGNIKTDHESVTVEEQLEKLRLGMYVILRRGSIQEPMNAGELINQLSDTSRLLLTVDGCISIEDLLQHGHMSWAIRQIITEGVDPLIAIQMATINVARCYGLESQLGLIAPGRFADILFVSNLTKFEVSAVMINGEILSGQPTFNRFQFPDVALHTIQMEEVTVDDLKVIAPVNSGSSIKTRIIELVPDTLLTNEIIEDLQVQNGEVLPDPSHDILKVAVFNRYGDETRTNGFIRGFGLKSGAMAGSIGQDSQNIVVVGTNDCDMAVAVNRIRQLQGGVVVVAEGKILAELPLPIAGIMTDIPSAQLVIGRAMIFQALLQLGCNLTDPIFTLSLCITLVVIPKLKMSNLGMVDVFRGKIVPLFV